MLMNDTIWKISCKGNLMIPLVDLKIKSKTIQSQINQSISNVIKSSNFIFGEDVIRFEEEFANYIGRKYCVSVGSGTDAILLSLLALGVGPGDEVIVPAMTFIASVTPILFSGAKAVLVDISDDLPIINAEKIEKAISKNTKAILVVHLHGIPCNMDEIGNIARKHDLKIIEDACQAHGSLYKNKKAGSFGLISAFSFYPAKNLGAFGDGGAVVLSDKLLVAKIKMLRNHGEKNKYHHYIKGFNTRLDSIQAAVLRVKLRYLDYWNNKRRRNAHTYFKYLKHPQINIPKETTNSSFNYHIFGIRTKLRNELMQYLKQNGVICAVHYPLPVHLHRALKSMGYTIGDFPNAEKFAKETLSLPLYPELKEQEIKKVCNLIFKFYKQ